MPQKGETGFAPPWKIFCEHPEPQVCTMYVHSYQVCLFRDGK